MRYVLYASCMCACVFVCVRVCLHACVYVCVVVKQALGLAQLKSTAALLPPAALSTLHTRHGVRGIRVGCGWSAGAAVAGQRRRCVKMLEDRSTMYFCIKEPCIAA